MKQGTAGWIVITLVLVVGMLACPSTYGGTITLSGGTLTLANYYSEDTLEIAGDSTISVARNFTTTWNGALTGSAQLTKSGAGDLRLTAASSGYSGAVVLATDGGRLILRDGGTLTGAASFTVNPGATLLMDDVSVRTIDRLVGKPITLQGGTLSFSAINTAGQITQSVGAVTLPTASGVSAASTINATGVSSGSELTLASLTRLVGDGIVNFTHYSANSTVLGANAGSNCRIYLTQINTGGGLATPTGGAFLGAWATVSSSDFAAYVTGTSVAGGVVAYGSTATGAPTYTALTTATAPGANGWASGNIGNASGTVNLGLAGVGGGQVFSVGALRMANAGLTLGFLGNATTPDTLYVETGGILAETGNGVQSIGAATSSFTRGILTAGANGLVGSAPVELFVNKNLNTITINSVIMNNPGGGGHALTLVKGLAGGLTLTAANTYTGGTLVLGGTLTANVAGSLGTGAVKVNNAILTLSLPGSTSFSSAGNASYTSVNGAQVNIANGNFTNAGDTFSIGAGSIIAGNATTTANNGINSLTRVANLAAINAGGNVVLVPDSIVAFGGTLTTGLGTGILTLKANAGTAADLYFGLAANTVASSTITVGTGTPWLGISTDRSARNYLSGTITANSDFNLQGFAVPGATPSLLTMGSTGAMAVNTPNGNVNANILGAVTWTTASTALGSANNNLTFQVNPGATFTLTPANALGATAGSTVGVVVQNGGTLAIGNAGAINAGTTVQAGGKFNANQAAGLTGTGALTFNEGSIIDITHATGFSGSQATAATVNAGTIVRINNAAPPGTAAATLDSFLGSKSPIYQLSGDVDVPEPASLTTTMTLNKNGSGVGGIVVNGSASAFFRNNVNGQVTIGANGGVMAATTGTELQVNENIEGTGVTLTFGTTNIIDGLPKRGSVALGSATGSNGYTGGTIINAGTLRQGYANVLGNTANQLTVNTGGTLNMGGQALAVGNLTGTGGAITNGGTLTIGQGDNGGGNFQGSIQNSTAVTKTGTGTNTLSGANTYTGATTVNGGKLLIDGNQSTASGTVTVGSGATLGGKGTIGGNVTIAASGHLAFNLSTVATSHDKLELAAGKSLTFSGASVLDITESGFLPAAGVYTLVTAPGGIIGATLPTATLPAGYAATVQKNGINLELNVTSVPARGGDLDYFEISPITSPQEAGTEITGITITARDENDLTANFEGTVTFGGLAGISGTSASFTAGVLTGVSVTPTVAGSDMTLIVTDSSGKTGMATFNVSPGALDHFTISAITSPQTAGTAIPGITLTARDANTNTVTGFGGTVTYSGTAGINETSAPFTAGVLSGVSVTPTVAGSGRTFIVTGSGETGTATFDVDPGSVHHFAITGFTPTGVVGTPVTPITITAQDANNNTVTGFGGTVTYGGTAGITGTSGNFTAGVLAGVSVTPTEAGAGASFTVSSSGVTSSTTADVGWVNGMVMMAAASVQVGTTNPVASVRANSPYPPITYTKTGGRDAASFNVNPTTGELTMTAPAGVVGTKYYVLVMAEDDNSNTDSILVEVTSTGSPVLSGSVIRFR